jgi:hypothetical protein
MKTSVCWQFKGEAQVLGLWMLAACTSDPVLVGLKDLVVEEPVSVAVTEPYEKPKGVFVDVSRFGGRQWNQIRGEVEKQMGELRAKVDHGRDGMELRLARGSVRILDDQVQIIHVELPYVMRRSQAMEAVGLPPQVREWHGNERDWVAHHAFGFERIRMGRDAPDSELVVWVEARKFNGRKR